MITRTLLYTGVSLSLFVAWLSTVLQPGQDWTDGAQALMTVAREEQKEAYERARDDLIARHPEHWDVAEAVGFSWEAGLLALILNARLAEPGGFEKCDTLEPERTRALRWEFPYRNITLSEEGTAAFLIEQVWKTSEYDDVAFDTLAELTRVCGTGRLIGGPRELWVAVWANAQRRDLRAIAIHAIASYGDEAARDMALAALMDNDLDLRTKEGVIAGLKVGASPYARDIYWQVAGATTVDCAVRALALGQVRISGDHAVREKLYAYARDQKCCADLRCTGLGVCNTEPMEEDVVLLLSILRDDDSRDLQLCLLHVLGMRVYRDRAAWSAARVAPTLQELVYSDAADDVKKEAISLLCRHGSNEDIEFAERIRDNEALSSDVRESARRALKSREIFGRERATGNASGPMDH